jgi:colanic acid/amylovoran biosynthesis glycosyltransferase
LSELVQNQTHDIDVNFRGYVDEAQLTECFHSSRIVVVPSVKTPTGDVEGVPLVVLEAMTIGKSIVATKVGGIEDVLEDGHSALLVQEKSPNQLAQAIKTLISDHHKASILGKRARRAALENSTESVTKRLFESLSRSNVC